MENPLSTQPVSVRLYDIMSESTRGNTSAKEKKIESIRRMVHTYNNAHLPVTRLFKRITCDIQCSDEMFTVCETFYEALINDTKYTDMLAESICNVLTFDLCRLEAIKYDATLSLEEATRAVISHEIKISHRYELLAKVVHRSEMLTRECLLTVFSLNPAWKNYVALTEFHKQYAASKRYQSLNGLNSILGNAEHIDYDPDVDPVQSILRGDKLATRFEKYGLWNDLVSLIINPRIKTLRWSRNNWPELQRLCLRYHNEPDLKICLIQQNVAAVKRDSLWYAQANSRELAWRVLQRTVKRLSDEKTKHQRRKDVCCYDEYGALVGFVQMQS